MSRYAGSYNAKTRKRELDPGDKVLIILPTDHNKLLLQWKDRSKLFKGSMIMIIV